MLGNLIVLLMEVVLKPALPHLSNPGNGSERQALFQKAEPPERESLEKLAEEWHLGEIGDRRSGSRTAVCRSSYLLIG